MRRSPGFDDYNRASLARPDHAAERLAADTPRSAALEALQQRVDASPRQLAVRRYNEMTERAGEAGDLDGLPVGSAHDPLEREADRVADRVVRRIGAPAGPRSPGARPRGSGLDPHTLSRMSRGFGVDFSRVRLHTDGASDRHGRALEARAFTIGGGVHFRAGQYRPGTRSGEQLIAHELAHTIQQAGGSSGLPVGPISSDAGGPVRRRLMSYAAYKKATKSRGRRKTIGALDRAFKTYTRDAGSLSLGKKYKKLESLIALCNTYLGQGGHSSTRRAGVETLKSQLKVEYAKVQRKYFLEDARKMGGGEFVDKHVTHEEAEKVGGQMNSLDLLTYDFGVVQDIDRKGRVTDKVHSRGEFTGYFKEETHDDQLLEQTRGAWTGISKKKPRYSDRGVATYEVAKLLDPRLIPPTFKAKHRRGGELVKGQIMEEVAGTVGRDLTDTDKQSAIFRQQLSNLRLLDFLCGQVDRHAGNYIVQRGEDDEITGVVGIDNDLAFGEKYTDFKFGLDSLDGVSDFMIRAYANSGGKLEDMPEIDKRFAKKITALARKPKILRKSLEGLLTEKEIKATLSRLKHLARYLKGLIDDDSDKIKSDWR